MRGSQALMVTAAATVVSAAGLVAVVLLGRPTPVDVAATPEPVYATVSAMASDRNQPVVVSAALTAAPVVRSAGAAGLVTEVTVRAGDTVDDGSAVYSADGVPVHAYVSPTPFFRPLSIGDTGEDVVALQEFLARHTERAVLVDGRFGSGTAAAVRDWQRGLGLAPTGVADPSWFVRLDSPGTVQSVELAVGSVAPGLGETLLTLRPEIASLEVAAERETPPGEYLLIVPSGRTALDFDGSAWTADDPSALASILSGNDTGTSAEPAGAEAASQSGTSERARVQARLALTEPVPAVVVPPGALVASSAGDGVCVWQRHDDMPVRIEDLTIGATTASGAALVEDPTLDGVDLLLDPLSALPDATCP